MKYNDDKIERFPDTANEPKMLRKQKYAKENVLEQDSLTISKRKNFDPEYFTFKVKILIGDTVETLAEVNSDSMLPLISEKFFNNLKNLQVPMQFLKEQPTQYNGMGEAEMISPLSLLSCFKCKSVQYYLCNEWLYQKNYKAIYC